LRQAFFNCWTRKEAYLKASGFGLSKGGLRSFRVSCDPNEIPRLSIEGQPPGVRSPWSLIDLKPDAGYAAAVVVSGSRSRLSAWRLGGKENSGQFDARASA
jgi:4'-phosphopantetheinyl transferase